MNSELRKSLRERFLSEMFNNRFRGFECGDGWLQIVQEMLEDLEPLVKNRSDFSILQIKEKFGDLRVYVEGYLTDEINNVFNLAELKASETCDICGEKAVKDYDEGWITIRCDLHKIK